MRVSELVSTRVERVVWLGLALAGGALGTVAPLPTLTVVLVLGAWIRPRWLLGLCLAMALVGLVRGNAVITRYEAVRARVIASGPWPERCELDGVVSASPARAGTSMRVTIDAREIRCRDGPALRGTVSLYVPLELENVRRGDRVRAIATLAPPYRFWNDDAGDPRPGAARRDIVLSGGAEDLRTIEPGWGIRSSIDRVRAVLRTHIDATFPADTAPMARALVLGEDDLDEADSRAFRKSGLAHLLAVSGMHLVLVVMGLVAAFRVVLVRISALAARYDVLRIASAIGIPVAWIYADLAGGSGSAIRAAWMCSVALLARAMGRRSEPWRALGLSILAMATADPLVAFDVSFVLSALATAGILGLSRPIEATIERHLPKRLPPRIATVLAWVAKPFSTTCAATIACAPVLGLLAPELPLGGLLANLLAVPVGDAAALPLCLLHGLLGGWPAAEAGTAWAASGALSIVRFVARSFTWGAVPMPVPTAGELAVLAGGTGLFVLARVPRSVTTKHVWRRRKVVLLASLFMLVALEIVTRAPPSGVLRVTFLDVGQGDSALVDLPDGSAMLIDGGGLVGSPIDVGERAVAATLAARRRRDLAVVVLSHPHPDHFLGLRAGLARASVGEFWDTGQGESDRIGGVYGALLDDLRARHIPIRRPNDLCGTHRIGGAIVDVLAPCPGPAVDRGANDNSFVLRIRYGDRAILFAGDAERAEEKELTDVRADVLKVGHHGSRTSSSPEFLAAVSPSIAVVSCGIRNRFGHPHPQTLSALHATGATVYRTDVDGSVIVTTDGKGLTVRKVSQ